MRAGEPVGETGSRIDAAPGAPPIMLIGLPGSGKSSVGKVLAALLGRDFVDTDRVLQTRFGQTITNIVAQRGWQEFRRLESEALLHALDSPRVVIAGGGGVVELPANREAIAQRAQTVWLRAAHQQLLTRLVADTTERPLLHKRAGARLAELAQARESYYAELADYRIDTDKYSVHQVAQTIARIIGGNTEQAYLENAD